MADFTQVTFEYYQETLGKSVIPNETEFNKYKLENIQLMKSWLPYVLERSENGVVSATCLMIEVDYVDSQLLNGESDNSVSSESVNGHSISYGSTAKTELEKLNAKSTADRKMDKARLFLYFDNGVL